MSKKANKIVFPGWFSYKALRKESQHVFKKVSEKLPKTGWGRTPLHFSAWKNKVNVTKTLLDAIGNNDDLINQHVYKEDLFQTPLHYASSYGHTGIEK